MNPYRRVLLFVLGIMSTISANTKLIGLAALGLVVAWYGDFNFSKAPSTESDISQNMSAIPVIVCGQTPSIARGVIAGLKPEIEGTLHYHQYFRYMY